MITYVQWNPNSDDLTPLDLHQESLTIPPPIKINRTVIDNFDELFQRYDGQLSDTLQKADSRIDQIEETTISLFLLVHKFSDRICNGRVSWSANPNTSTISLLNSVC